MCPLLNDTVFYWPAQEYKEQTPIAEWGVCRNGIRGRAVQAVAWAVGRRTFVSIMPLEMAWRVKPATSWIFSLFMTCWRCFSTVLMLMFNSAAICLLAW